MGRHVITLDKQSFGEVCLRLQRLVQQSGFKPDLVLSIATGGVYVGEKLFAGADHLSVRLQRPGTRAKTPLLKDMMKHLPVGVLNAMRITEASLLDLMPKRVVDPATVTLPSEVARYKNILIADDAVDSGATMLAVRDAVAAMAPGTRIATAAITVTTLKPLIKPDFAIFNNLTLIRFPWSLDS